MSLAPFAIAFLAAVAPQTDVTVVQDHTGLIPSGTTILLRLESVDKVHASLTRLNGVAGVADEMPSKAAMFTDLFQMPVGLEGVDTTRPFYLSWDLSQGEPQLTLLIPATQSQVIVDAATEAGAVSFARENWVGVSKNPDYVPAASNPLLSAMLPGVLSLRVDLESLLETFGPMIKTNLEQAQDAIVQQMELTPSPMDMAAIMSLYFDGFELMLDSAESMDLALHESSDEITLYGTYRALEGSDLAGAASTQPLPTTLPVAAPANSQITYFSAANAGELYGRWIGLMNRMLDIYPEDMRSSMKTMLHSSQEILGKMGHNTVGFGGFGPGGLYFDYYVDYPGDDDPTAILRKLLLDIDPAMTSMGASIGELRQVELAGISALQVPYTYDYKRLMENLGVPGEGPEAEELNQATLDMIKTMYGENPVFTFAHANNKLWMNMGGDLEQLQRSAVLLAGPRADAAPLLSKLRGLPPTVHPLLMYDMDFGAMMQTMRPMMEASGGAFPFPFPFPEVPLRVNTWMGINGRDWLGGLTMKPAQLRTFIEATKEF